MVYDNILGWGIFVLFIAVIFWVIKTYFRERKLKKESEKNQEKEVKDEQ